MSNPLYDVMNVILESKDDGVIAKKVAEELGIDPTEAEYRIGLLMRRDMVRVKGVDYQGQKIYVKHVRKLYRDGPAGREANVD